MTFEEMQVGIDVFKPHGINEEVGGVYLSGCVEAEHDKVYVGLHRRSDPEFTPDELSQLGAAGWWYDVEVGSWCHFC